MTIRLGLALGAALWFTCLGCAEPPPPKVVRARFKPMTLAVPASEQRATLRDAYRLRPDRRFLLAFGELRRLEAGTAEAGTPAEALYANDQWTIRLGEREIGTLPELPDFPDYLALLVRQAKGSSGAAKPSPPRRPSAFLMPGLLEALRAADGPDEKSSSLPDLTRSFARLAFQMNDRLETAPVIPARALALLAAVRAREPGGYVEEEVLLAHSLGYTAHAEMLAATLPGDSPLRAFESQDDALGRMASSPSSTEEVRYLALRRATDAGDFEGWKQARARWFPNDSSPAVIATGLDLSLPAQVEVTERQDLLGAALPRAVLRELGGGEPAPQSEGDPVSNELDRLTESAAAAAKGRAWDGAALAAYYRAMYHAPMDPENQTVRAGPITPFTLELYRRLAEAVPNPKQPPLTPEQAEDPIGAPLLVERERESLRQVHPSEARVAAEIRALVRRLDSRPVHRADLAYFSHYNLIDPRLAEDLHRSLLRVLGDVSRKPKAVSALYVGDWASLERLLRSPSIQGPAASEIAWSWHASRVEPERLELELDRLMTRFPSVWLLANTYLESLRAREKYREGCELLERWLLRNPDRRTPGRFHAQIRLAHNYALAGEFEKGRKLLEGMAESERFQNAIRRRSLAEQYAGLGRLPEAEKLILETIDSPRWGRDSDDVRTLAEILWAQGRDDEAADALSNAKYGLSSSEICQALAKDLPRVFAGHPPAEWKAAVGAVAGRPVFAHYYQCASSGFAHAKRFDQAFEAASLFSPPEKEDQRILQYEYMKSWKGPEAAAEWLKTQIPAGTRNPMSMKALYTKNDDLLWDVIGPDTNDHPEWVWLFRAVAFALRGEGGEARRAALLAYYQRTDPDPFHAMGRHLVGLASEAELLALATNPARLSEVTYYLGVRAQGDRRFRDACEWYRVSMETQNPTSPRKLAIYTLIEWSNPGQGIWRVEAKNAAAKQAPTTAAGR